MDTKQTFRSAAILAFFTVFVALVVIIVLAKQESIALFNLCVDVVVGFFTVWGLYWAASAFADAQVKPELRLALGRAENGACHPVEGTPVILPGEYDPDNGRKFVRVALLLENAKTKAGIYVRVIVRVRAVPPPKEYDFEAVFIAPQSFCLKGPDFLEVTLQFRDDLVVYQTINFPGFLRLFWAIADTPSKHMELDYRVFTGDGPPTRSESPIPMQVVW